VDLGRELRVSVPEDALDRREVRARVQHELEKLLGCGVDLATPGMIRKEYRDRIYA
jgi:predicted nucleotidyltransferase